MIDPGWAYTYEHVLSTIFNHVTKIVAEVDANWVHFMRRRGAVLHMTYPRTSRNLQSLPFAVTVEATAAKGVLPPGQHPRCRRPSSLSSALADI